MPDRKSNTNLQLICTTLLLCLFPFLLFSKTIKAGIYTTSSISEVLVKVASGTYDVYGSGNKVASVTNDMLLYFSFQDGKIFFSLNNAEIGQFIDVKFVAADTACTFRIKPVKGSGPESLFDDNLIIKPLAGKGLQFINEVNIENYTAGVLESEIGMNTNKEFLKVHSIISRTYAIYNLKRHAAQGFDLCDQEHCQVYKGKSRRNLLIGLAVTETAGQILADQRGRPIVAAFHSNCGGQTYNSEDIWPAEVPYLRSVPDSFCLASPHARWQQKIPVQKWTEYLARTDSSAISKGDSTLNYSFAPESKFSAYTYKNIRIPAKKVRTDWNFRSPFFTITQLNDTLYFSGKGFGHGIGLCQEGAMRMADAGFSYLDIINYYYRRVSIISINDLH